MSQSKNISDTNSTQLVEDNDNFKNLVSLVDKLRDVGLSDHISMPRIAVCGSQSSGKSSLLESIVGLNFLPRGSGVVTRRPLELRLVRSKNMQEAPYGIFKEVPDKKFTDFNLIRKKIEQLTDQVCGTNKNIVDNPIVLQIFSFNCPDLTVIDLPGITRIPIAGQDKNIEQITKSLVTRYCRDERTIILAVVPANADMTTSEALQLAQDLDPQGVRTIGVITKIDIMDKGTDARNMLLNKEIPLKMGYIGVKGRSQEDVNNNMTVSRALKTEMDFFINHPAYRHLPRELLGTECLVRKLSSIMYSHMKNVMPSIVREINLKIKNCESNLHKLGTPIPVDNKDKLDSLWKEISIFYDELKAELRGDFLKKDVAKIELESKVRVLASAQINMLFNKLYNNYIMNYKASAVYRDSEIEKTVAMHSGNTLPGYISMDCFLALSNPLLEKMRSPAIELLENINSVLKTCGSRLIGKSFHKHSYLKEILAGLYNELLEEVI